MNRTGIPILLWGSALGLLLAVLSHFAGVYVILTSLVLSATIFLIAAPVAASYPKTLRALDEFSALSTPIETIETSNCSYDSADGKTFSLNVDEFWTSYRRYDSETKLWEYVD
ncbi:MAG: hypothetical protein AAF921_05155 [Cyanobacteria bacterium P01_D01_bin.44]